MRKTGGRGQFDGYMTVFLSLSLTVLLSLILTLIEGARMNAVRMQIELATDAAMNSVLGEFNRELLKQYDLFFIDASFGTAEPSEENIRTHLEEYLAMNYGRSDRMAFGSVRTFTGLQTKSLVLTGTRCAADHDADALREQVYAYMSADPAGAVISSVLAEADRFNGLGLDTGEWQRKKAENDAERKELFEEAAEKQEAEGSSEELEDPVKAAGDFFSGLALEQTIEGSEKISEADTDTKLLLSNRAFHTGDDLKPENTHSYPRADTVIFDEYILEKCNAWKNSVKESRMQYEAEYILFGQGADRDNLGRMAEALLFARQAANCISIFGDSAKCAEAETMASAAAIILLMPEAEEVIKTSILFAWAYTESLQDVKTLFSGGRVPLIKSSSEWKTSIFSIFAPGISTHGETGGTGLNYSEYLRIFLFLENGSMKNYRLMDVMEMDIRETKGNEHFRMDWCVDAFGIASETESNFGYCYPLKREISYN